MALILVSSQRGRATVPAAGHDERRIDLDERLEREGPLVQARVGQRQPRLVDGDAVDEEQIEVDRARPVARPLARPAELALDVEQGREELPRAPSVVSIAPRR